MKKFLEIIDEADKKYAKLSLITFLLEGLYVSLVCSVLYMHQN